MTPQEIRIFRRSLVLQLDNLSDHLFGKGHTLRPSQVRKLENNVEKLLTRARALDIDVPPTRDAVADLVRGQYVRVG